MRGKAMALLLMSAIVSTAAVTAVTFTVVGKEQTCVPESLVGDDGEGAKEVFQRVRLRK